ncbi:hypothetical protein DUI87_09310 [Hirundo rustica rustica]|uniref:Integrase catalytic domain-containing protein n=1 Tax=Hirundo rustica rustica TaxID=333673 RepID=A0A3M0KLU7_HIRRU|nr:hypothetical protein DUI87_09310 [Hirundo rustica rustica]
MRKIGWTRQEGEKKGGEAPMIRFLIQKRLRLSKGLHLKDADWTLISANTEEQGAWPVVEGEFIVIGDCKHTPQEIKILPAMLVNNPGSLILWLCCTHPPTYLPKEQVITQIIPTWGLINKPEASVACPVQAITEERPRGGLEKSMDAIKHLVQAFSFMGIPTEFKTDNGLVYRSKEFCSFLQQWGVEHKTGIPHSPRGQAVVERIHRDIKRVLHQQRVLKTEPPSIRLARALFTINFLNCSFEGLDPPVVRHFGASHQFNIRERPPVMVRNPETGKAEGPHNLVTWGRGYACVSTPMGPKWLTLVMGQERFFQFVYQTRGVYTAGTWCDCIAHVKMVTTHDADPLALPRGVFLICGDRAWAGIPSCMIGGLCTFSRLGLFSPNKTTLMDWQRKNSTQLVIKKRDLSALDADCDSEIIHWSKSKGVVITVFLPWVSIAKALGELVHLECWVAKQANLTSNALASLLSDEEEITRQATLQNRAAIDYLLLLHGHRCEEFEGLCYFNLSSKAENIYNAFQKIREMVRSIKKETYLQCHQHQTWRRAWK